MSHHLIPYRYVPPRDRMGLNRRVDADAFEDLRNMVAWLRGQGAAVASLEQELTVAIRAHVASMAARFGMPGFPAREGDLQPGRRAGVHSRAARIERGELADVAPELGDVAPAPPPDVEVRPGVRLSDQNRRRIQSLIEQGEADIDIAALLEIDVEVVRKVAGGA